VPVKQQLMEAGRAVVHAASENGDGTWVVPGEPLARLRAAVGEEH
jgi:hypothetical protein